jgi:hypothetical protein
MELIMALEIPGRLPSWNEVLSMEYHDRASWKEGIQNSFLSALQRSANAFSTTTTPAKSIMLTASDTLASFIVTRAQQRALKRRNGGARKGNRKK